MRVNSATTRISVNQQKNRNTWRPQKPMSDSITVPIERPWWRIERNMAAKSWTVPMRMQPRSTQSTTATHPYCAASTGPTIGPAPAMLAKWWPNRIAGCVGT